MPLTTRGIAIQVLASIRAHRDYAEHCTVNDCKVVVNHLIRKFSEPLGRASEAEVKMSAAVRAGAWDDTVRDHAVPVITLLEELLKLEDKSLVISEANINYVEDFLRRSLYVVEITDDEDRRLCSSGYQRKMPTSWSTVGHAWYRDPLARYKECGIEL